MPNYPIPENPVYDSEITQLQDTDPASATNTFNPLFQKLINNTHAVKLTAQNAQDTAAGKESALNGASRDAGVPTEFDEFVVLSQPYGFSTRRFMWSSIKSAIRAMFPLATKYMDGLMSYVDKIKTSLISGASMTRDSLIFSNLSALTSGAYGTGERNVIVASCDPNGAPCEGGLFSASKFNGNVILGKIANHVDMRGDFEGNTVVGDCLPASVPLSAGFNDCTFVGKNIFKYTMSPTKSHNSRVVALGSNLLNDSENCSRSVFVGHDIRPGYANSSTDDVYIGVEIDASLSNESVIIGKQSGPLAAAESSVYLGKLAGRHDTSGNQSYYFQNVTCLGANSRVSGSNQLQLGASNVTVYAQTAIQTRSDARDKTDIRPLDYDALRFILSLKPVQYRLDPRCNYETALEISESDFDALPFEEQLLWSARTKVIDEDGETSEVIVFRKVEQYASDGTKAHKRIHNGFIAQDVGALLNDMRYDFAIYQDHKVNGGDDVLSLSYEEFIAPMVRAMQQQQEQIASLTDRIEKLENLITEGK